MQKFSIAFYYCCFRFRFPLSFSRFSFNFTFICCQLEWNANLFKMLTFAESWQRCRKLVGLKKKGSNAIIKYHFSHVYLHFHWIIAFISQFIFIILSRGWGRGFKEELKMDLVLQMVYIHTYSNSMYIKTTID